MNSRKRTPSTSSSAGTSTLYRRTFELIDGGEEIRWPTLDEDLSVPGLLGLPD